jgi:hypothetical protein
MDKETLDKKVAAIWNLYSATKTLNSAGIVTPAISGYVAGDVLRKSAIEIGEALAVSLAG